MAASHTNIKSDKLTIFTASKTVEAPEIRKYIIKHWKEISIGLDNSTVLFIGGVHGHKDGYVADDANNMGQIENQVSFLDKQNYIPT